MKKTILFLLFILSSLSSYSQNYQLKIVGSKPSETAIIDSLQYRCQHTDEKSLQDEVQKTTEILTSLGYIELKTISNIKVNDKSYVASIQLGEKTTTVHLSTSASKEIRKIIDFTKDSVIIPYSNLKSFLSNKKNKLTEAGFALSTIRLINITKKQTFLIAELEIIENKQKKINAILVAKDDSKNINFNEGHLKQINKKYNNSILSQKTIQKINEEFNKYTFAKQTKYPETLFTTDSTKVYIYLEKRKANNFDGFIGFNNNESRKINLSGYLDLQLENILNASEAFHLNWRSAGNNKRTFNTSLEIPYLFKSPFGLKAQLNIFKQDSTFQNTKTSLEISYLIKYNTRLYLGTETTNSSDIQNTNSTTISDFKSNFVTTSFEYNLRDETNLMTPDKIDIHVKAGIGKRTNATEATNKQNYLSLKTNYTLYINKKNNLNIKVFFNTLNSASYSLNELLRFGGINSIRGFQDNSLTARSYFIAATEYRYFINKIFYINSVLDYGHYNIPNNTATTIYNNNLVSAGIGFALNTKNGILRFSAVNNYNNVSQTSIYNNLVHLSYNVKF